MNVIDLQEYRERRAKERLEEAKSESASTYEKIQEAMRLLAEAVLGFKQR